MRAWRANILECMHSQQQASAAAICIAVAAAQAYAKVHAHIDIGTHSFLGITALASLKHV